MFEQTFVDGTGKTSKPYTVLVSLLIQSGLIVLGIIIPMWFFEGLQPAQLANMLVAPPPSAAASAPACRCPCKGS